MRAVFGSARTHGGGAPGHGRAPGGMPGADLDDNGCRCALREARAPSRDNVNGPMSNVKWWMRIDSIEVILQLTFGFCHLTFTCHREQPILW
ncbi:hypothetical protein DESC_740143 [Desulfosarcina cetonica]|nr:hypothetical protein DESC_740143 [Desulfosarcina cetonica]